MPRASADEREEGARPSRDLLRLLALTTLVVVIGFALASGIWV